MRNFLQLVASATLLATQATSSFPGMVAASTEPLAEVGVNSEVKLNVNNASPIQLARAEAPDFNSEVGEPLRAAQAERARQEAERQAQEAAARAAEAARRAEEARRAAEARRVAVAPAPAPSRVVVPGNDVWAALRMCEAGGNYAANTGNGYYGAYQFDIRTWGNYGGYYRPDLAPPAVQDQKARMTQAARGWYPWPGCARKLGLI